MPSRRALSLTLASLLASVSTGARAAASIWVSHDVPPFLWRGEKGAEGYAFDLFKRIVKHAELNAELQFFPWARALRMLQSNQADAALLITRTPDREGQFRWLFPVGRFRFAAFTRPALGPISGDIAALKSRRVGSLRASVSRGMLESAGVSRVVEGKDYPELLALLNRGIVDVVIGPESVLRTLDTREGSEALRVTLMDQGYDFYAAAGPAMSDETVRRVLAAYQHLVDTGVVAQLRKSHPEASFGD